MKDYPTLWQRKMMWAALTACFVVVFVVIVAAVIWAGASIVSFLQPILIPVAIAATYCPPRSSNRPDPAQAEQR